MAGSSPVNVAISSGRLDLSTTRGRRVDGRKCMRLRSRSLQMAYRGSCERRSGRHGSYLLSVEDSDLQRKKYRLQTRRHMKYLMQAERLQPRAGTGRRSGADMGRQLLTKLSPHADRPDLILACLQVWGQRWPFHLISERRRHREKHARPESAGALMSHVWCCRIGQGSGSQGQGTRRRKEQPGGQRICPECGAGCAACPAAARSTTGVRSVWR